MGKFNFPISKCPHCGGGTIAIKQQISGYGIFYVDLKSEEIDATCLHDSLNYKNTGKYAICADCGERLFRVDDELNVIHLSGDLTE